MAEHLPAIQFYPGDWLKDPKLSMCSPATRGIWIDAICAMHNDSSSGILAGTLEQLSRVLRCTVSELESSILELQNTGAADVEICNISVTCNANVTECNKKVTLICRRMYRLAKERLATNERVAKWRGNKKVTIPSSSSSSSSPSRYIPPTPKSDGVSPPEKRKAGDHKSKPGRGAEEKKVPREPSPHSCMKPADSHELRETIRWTWFRKFVRREADIQNSSVRTLALALEKQGKANYWGDDDGYRKWRVTVDKQSLTPEEVAEQSKAIKDGLAHRAKVRAQIALLKAGG